MKDNTYKVYFKTGFSQLVYALGSKQAKILAQAREIQAGRDYTVTEIKQLEG